MTVWRPILPRPPPTSNIILANYRFPLVPPLPRVYIVDTARGIAFNTGGCLPDRRYGNRQFVTLFSFYFHKGVTILLYAFF